MIKYFFVVLIMFNTNSLLAQIQHKRIPPKKVKSVILNGIKYTAPANKMGYIVALDAKSDSVIWEKQIYKINFNRNLETDVQCVFINLLCIQHDSLIIHTERNRVYSLKLN
jgi:hypothetical protein